MMLGAKVPPAFSDLCERYRDDGEARDGWGWSFARATPHRGTSCWGDRPQLLECKH